MASGICSLGQERQLTPVPKGCMAGCSSQQLHVLRRHAKAFFPDDPAAWLAGEEHFRVPFLLFDPVQQKRYPGARGVFRPVRGGRYPGARGALHLVGGRHRTSWALHR
jgi:hypothetical protein